MCGDIFVDVNDDFYIINFPSYSLNEINVTDEMTKAIGVKPVAAYINRDLMLIVESESEVRNLKINQKVLKNLDGLATVVTVKFLHKISCDEI